MDSREPPERSDQSHEEFVVLLTASHDRLMGYLLSLLGRWHDAEDVLQRASVLMWRKFGSFESGTDFTSWASTFCFYEAKNFQRTVSRSPLHFDDDLLALLAEERDEDRRLLLTSCSGHGGITALAMRSGRAPRTFFNKLAILRRLLAECVMSRLHEETT
jgi:RNA polymerase sigma-70 factor (ECF subfamily)